MPVKKETEKTKVEKKSQKLPAFYQAIGRRKTATARVRLYPVIKTKIAVGDLTLVPDQFIVNNRPINEYFSQKLMEKKYLQPLKVTNNLGRFAATIKVEGSGINGQLEAVMHGISRALLEVDNATYKPLLRKEGLLTRDPRMKERRKAGLAGKARAGKQSPKR